ncbi:interleukin-10 receptor subunit beta [Solea solea]|uniref:interleukin-10 receptor subunit beta n=1 Tax=Solea solea TaxID=90069 RepID=UPI00272ABC6C|nr:interleukin-10 receptor subunit beta [Solea solea]
MSAAIYACLFFWGLQTSEGIDVITVPTSITVRPELPPPQNVIVISLNTNYTLSWEWNQSHSERGDVTFTTQYVGFHQLKSKIKTPNWFTACKETSRRSCDLTALHYLSKYELRVQANTNGHHSEWVKKEFCPEKDAVLGPPAKVVLEPAGSDLEVIISEPMTSDNSSMRKYLEKMYYLILYWERSADSKVVQIQRLTSIATMVILPKLKAWTWYCVSVQSRSDDHAEPKNSSFTTPLCMQTEGNIPWWQIVLYFMASVVIFFLVVLLTLFCSFKCYKTLKKTLFPSNQLPLHLKEYLCGSPASDFPCLITPVSESELLCEKVTICEAAVLEIHNLPFEVMAAPPEGLELDSRHIRQDSSSSGDSGVYSAGGSSGLRQHNSSSLPGTGRQDLWQSATTDLEQVKMDKMTPVLKSRPLITEERIVDMRV